DMCSTGKRHAYRAEWDVGFDDEGRIAAYKVQFYSDGGAAADLSTSVMERTMLHAENAYFIANIDIRGRVCFTNYPPNTAFRGFGGPQGMASMENVIREIAQYLRAQAAQGNGKPRAKQTALAPQVDTLQVQLGNLYGKEDRNVTPYGQIFKKNHLPEILTVLGERCEYRGRLGEIEAANETDRLWLRGLAISPVKFGISFTTKFMNQGNALVNVYIDGT